MRIAKLMDRKGRSVFAEVLMIGSVLFDPRPGWVLLSGPLSVLPRKRDVFWEHPDDCMFVWVKEFNFL